MDKLTFETVPELFLQKEQYYTSKELDMSALKEVDSAGIAFLVHWSKHLAPNKLRLKAVPKSALSLINTFNLNELFEIV